MKRIVLVGIVVIILLMCTNVVTAAPPLHRVTGGGIYYTGGGIAMNILSVSAKQIDDQYNATGQVTEILRPTDGGPIIWAFEAEVLCLVVDGNQAWIAGNITSSTIENPDFGAVGDGILIGVEADSPDKIFSLISSSPDDMIELAKDKFDFSSYTFDLQGNIKIK